MPLPITTVVLVDEDGDEFPIALPGVYDADRAEELARILIAAEPTLRPNGSLTRKES